MHLLIVKYRDQASPSEISLTGHEALALARELDDTHTEWAEVLDEDGTIVWDSTTGNC